LVGVPFGLLGDHGLGGEAAAIPAAFDGACIKANYQLASRPVKGGGRSSASSCTQIQKRLTTAREATDPSHFMPTFNG